MHTNTMAKQVSQLRPTEMCQGVPEQSPLEEKIQVEGKVSSKPKMSCTQKVSIRLNSLESIWYCILIVVVTFFLLGDALRQYKHYNNLDWPDKPPRGELRLYLLLIFSAFALILLFIPTQIFKVGNRANDQDKLGLIKTRRNGFRKMSASSTPIKTLQQYVYKLRGISKHMGPVGATLHIISAFCLLLPLMFLQARAIENELLPTEMIWKSEVAVVSAAAYSVDVSANLDTISGPAVTPANLPPQDSSDMARNKNPFRVFMITINYLNYIVPLFFYAIRYAEVFWVSHKGFAFLFSAQLMMNAIHYALGFVGMSIMYKLSMYVHGDYNNDMENSPNIVQPSLLILAFLSMNITVFLSAVIFYLFGYTRYKLSESEVVSPDEVDGQGTAKLWILRFNGLLPHIGAFIVFVILIVCKGVFIVEYITVYSWLEDGDGRILCCILFDILFLLAWLALWVMFTFKLNWKFGFFSHPAPYSKVDGPSDSYRDQGSSNSDTDVESHGLNHYASSGHNAKEAETSFGKAGDTCLLAKQFENHRNVALVNEEPDRIANNSIKYADEDSSIAIDSASSPSKYKQDEKPKNPSSDDASRGGLMMEVSLEDDSPTVSSPMLPQEA
ncbi:uncharacterized protein [Apostichopus japonicus]|uniref:uncharacterized protein isoform X2 n=1 Tax=Stichopus japonicus TaxID=307972 RepID=UPI003AB2B771